MSEDNEDIVIEDDPDSNASKTAEKKLRERIKDAEAKAKEYAEKAVSIDDELAEAHASLAYTCMLYDWDWQRAEHEFKKSISLNPSYAQARLWYSQFLVGMGRFDEAIAEGRRAQELDPINLSINANVALVLYWAHENKRSCRFSCPTKGWPTCPTR